jgi:short-subunit dehydrogenase
MKLRLKKLHEQTIVITGASSGIGLVTARMAARQGARLVLAARSEQALDQLRDEITEAGGEAVCVVADVGHEAEVQQIANTAFNRFDGFDTWVNNAGVSIYGNILDVEVTDMRRLFETNFWGVVYGSRIAAAHLREHGGALINIGSTLSDRAIPVQGIYSASKHAVKGFTEALRMELEAAKAPVSVTLIKPGAIDTPYPHHARNYLETEPKGPAPVYAPEVVAEAILYAAAHPVRDIFAGGGGKFISASGKFLPRLTDKLMKKFTFKQQKSGQPKTGVNGLYQGVGKLEERGDHPGHVAESSLYTKATLHPVITTALLVSAGLATAAIWRATPGQKDEPVSRAPDRK